MAMNNALSGLSKTILAVMIGIVLVCGGVVFVIRGLEKRLAPMREATYSPRDKVEKGVYLLHGYWAFDHFDNSDYLTGSILDSLLKVKAIQPKANAGPEDYKAAQYYSCNYVPDSGEGYYYWVSLKEVTDPQAFKATVANLSKMYPYTLISNRYTRYFNDEKYDKRNRNRFMKVFGLPNPAKFEPVIVMEESHPFPDRTETPGVDSELDGFTVKFVDKDRLVMTYKDATGKLDLVYKNVSKLPYDILSYSVYFKGIK